jgi:hypothetical protein
VLQAIHLLLAFESFVVVVGVDVTWVQNALARDLVGADENVNGNGAIKQQRAIEYLEKIFQIAFWLSPLTNGANGNATYAQYLRGLVKAKPPNDGKGSGSTTAGAASGFDGADASSLGTDGNSSQQGQSDDEGWNRSGGGKGESESDEREIRGLGLIQLEQEEIDFLASPEIAAIAPTTPRSVKRLLNVYRLVRTRLGETGADLMGKNSAPAVYPLIAMSVAIETGQPVQVADDFFRGLKELPSETSITVPVTRKLGGQNSPDHLKKALDACPALESALQEVAKIRKNSMTAADALTVTRVARRYSFNREESTAISQPASPRTPD